VHRDGVDGRNDQPDPTGVTSWEDISMKTRFFTSVAALALVAGTAQAQDLLFPVGEGDFNWDSYQAFADATDLSGQTVTITGPWTGLDAELFESMAAYFEAATGADGRIFRLRQLRAGHRDRDAGRQPAQHRRLPAAGPDDRPGRPG
jgi:hypothetical protein